MDRGTRDTLYGLTVRAFVAALLALASFALAAAQAAPEQDEDADESPTSTALPAPADGARLVAADATWSYVAFVAPPLTRQLGASTLAALDAVHGRKSRAQVSDSAAAASPRCSSAPPTTACLTTSPRPCA
ncbi:MAG TPA: hypothetical protein PKU97_09860, partial [Kofleriaceae bacterium]|nr:hypothetical protein [Kofleriaceae bacterium]